MNILVLVLTLLLMLSSLTYSRLETHKNQSIQQLQFEKYAHNEERTAFNRRQSNLYESNGFSPAQLSLNMIMQKGHEKSPQGDVEKQKEWLKQLMLVLYQQAPFFIDLQQKRSDFVTELVNSIEPAVDRLLAVSSDPNKAILNKYDMGKITLADPELQHAFYLMLKGTISKDTPTYADDRNSIVNLPQGDYYSLIDFICYAKNKPKINSASPEFLELFFVKEAIPEILEKRAVRDGTSGEAQANATRELLELFNRSLKPGIDPADLDYFGKSSEQSNETEEGQPPANANPDGVKGGQAGNRGTGSNDNNEDSLEEDEDT